MRVLGVLSDAELPAYDARHVWHPYAPSGSSARVVESAEGVRIRLAGVGDVIDGMSSWWAAIHGYRHPALDAALVDQVGRMSHVMFGGLTHQPAVELTRRLLELAPGTYSEHPMQRVFLCDSGSVSVEVAVKLCLQYQRGVRGHGVDRHGEKAPSRFLTVRGGYHGDTFTAMSLCDPVNGMHSMFADVLPRQLFAPRPPAGFDLHDDDPAVAEWTAQVQELAERHTGELAGVIVEPVLQGAGGMHIYSPACLRALRQVADLHEVPLILDEIATGFGRTGAMFASEHAGVVPDIICVGKALTGGYLSLAAVLCSARIAAGVDASESGALMHGPTFMANPLACAVAGANLDLLGLGDWPGQVKTIESGLRSGLARLADSPGVRDVRVLGGLGVVQTRAPVDVPAVTAVALQHGVWLRPFRDLIYTMPPYISTPDEVARIAAAISAAVHEVVL
jgi:adenosylmethionine---8-amino-7-oxononanoate aminotransferase